MLLHEVVRWLVAGFLNVQAERAIAWPEAQEVGELKLNFIRLTKDVSRVKLAAISTAPFVAGIVVVYLITNHILNMSTFVEALLANDLSDVPQTLGAMTQTPDFLLWVYITFTIANTMLPDFADLKGWWIVLGVLGLAIAGLFAIGAGDEIVLLNLAGPITNGLRGLAGVFVAIIAIDVLVVAGLGTIEAIIERVTGHSATFKNGKMITLTREQQRELREQETAKRERQLAKRSATPAGPPSVYKLALPIPDPPDLSDLPGEKITVQREEQVPLPTGAAQAPRPAPTIFTRGVSVPPTPAVAGMPVSTPNPNDDDEADDEDDADDDGIERIPIDGDTIGDDVEAIPAIDDVIEADDEYGDDDKDDDDLVHAPPDEPA